MLVGEAEESLSFSLKLTNVEFLVCDASPAPFEPITPPVIWYFRNLYSEPLTPSSNTSLSPAGSPISEIAFEKPSLPSAADWSEFLSASTSEKVENEFAQLTLSDHEQRELYEAAKLVQTVFRKYKVRGQNIKRLRCQM